MLGYPQRDGLLFGAIGISVLLIGTATGNAYAMLGMSAVALVLLAVFGRKRLLRKGLLRAIVAAGVLAAMIGIVLTRWLAT